MIKRFALSTRIALIGILPGLCFALALFWIHAAIRTSHYEAKYDNLQQLIQSAWNATDYYGAQVRAGKMTLEDAQAAAKRAVRSMPYGKGAGDYFFINDLHPTMVMNPATPALEGKDLSGKQDPNGVYIFREIVKICRASGEGRLEMCIRDRDCSIPGKRSRRRRTWWTAIWTWRPRRADPLPCACFPCRPDSPKASCRQAISYWPHRSPAGVPSSGPRNITALWPRVYAPNWECLW